MIAMASGSNAVTEMMKKKINMEVAGEKQLVSHRWAFGIPYIVAAFFIITLGGNIGNNKRWRILGTAIF